MRHFAIVMAAAALLVSTGCNKPANDITSAELPTADPALVQASQAEAEILALFELYLRLHEEKKMEEWLSLFIPEAIGVEVEKDGTSSTFPVTELARGIAENAKTIRSQRETLDQVRIETHGGAGTYAARYTLFIDDEKVQTGRAFFPLIKKDGGWKIAGLVWQVD